MILFLDIDTRALLDIKQAPLRTLNLKRRDTDLIELQFLRDNTVQELPAGSTIKIGLKPSGAYSASFLATTSTFTKSGTGTSTKYLADLNLNTTELNTAFSSATPPEPDSLPAMLEIEWTSGTNISSSKTLPVTIANDVIRGNEGLPTFSNETKATQAEAEAGADNTKWMTPLRTKQAMQNAGPFAVNNNGQTLSISPEKIESSYWAEGGNTGTVLDFAQRKMTFLGSSVIEWADNYLVFPYDLDVMGNAYIENLSIGALNHPVNRLIPERIAHSFNTANQGVPFNYIADSANLRFVITSTSLTADPSFILKRTTEGTKFGDILRIQWSRTSHTRSLLVRHYPGGGTTLATLATLSADGVYGYAFDGANWVTEASFTGL